MFESAKQKVERAYQHLAQLEGAAIQFFRTRPYSITADFDEAVQLYGLRVAMTKPLPPVIPLIVGDFIHNVRSALEHVASDLFAAAAGNEEARTRSKFPMHEEEKNLQREVERSAINAAFPDVAKLIVDQIKPYKAGNRHLWLTGKLWNIDKHRLPIVSYGITEISGISGFTERGRNTFSNMTAVVEQGRAVGLIATDEPMTITNYGSATFYVNFDEPGLMEGDPVLQTLLLMAQSVDDAIRAIEAKMPAR
ncbi:MAG: hypothetical protein ABL308_05180 [Oceanicaulis sp.]